MRELRIRLLPVQMCLLIVAAGIDLHSQPVCLITGGIDVLCTGSSTIWSAPDGMSEYFWTGPSGFTATTRDISISLAGTYTVTITDPNGTENCSRNLAVFPELSPGTINTTLRQFCVGGTTPIGGTNPPYGPATGGSGSYNYVWQSQEECTGGWTDIPGTNVTSYTPVAPQVTTCYRRKVTDMVCNTENYTEFKEFEIFEDPVSQTIVPQPSDPIVCAGIPVAATFTGGSGGFTGGTTDVYEFSINSGSTWSSYTPDQNIVTSGLSGTNIIRIRTRRISTGVNGCNYGSYVMVSWSVNPVPTTSAIYHQ